MHAFTTASDGNGYKFQWSYDEKLEKNHIKTDINVDGVNYEAACPVPFLYHLSDHYFHLKSSDSYKTCEKWSDCEENEFCGHAYNPTYCQNEAQDKYYHNHCLDRSNNGKPMQFCYEIKSLGVPHEKLEPGRYGVGFDVGNKQKDCGTRMFYSKSSDFKFLKVTSNGTTDGKKYNGMCLEAHICEDDVLYSSRAAHFPSNRKSCEIGNDKSCGTYQQCIKSDINDNNLCCSLKHECISGQVPTKSCDENSVCNGENEVCTQLKNTDLYGCCDQRISHCNQTGLHAFTTVSNSSGQTFQWIYEDAQHFETHIKTPISSNGIVYEAACPKPLSYQLYDVPHPLFLLPVDFEKGGDALRTCERNSDCKDDEYCGFSSNPTYCHHNHCLDRSNNGTPMQYCYKSHIEEKTLKIRRDRIGFDVCNEQKDCGTRSICRFSSIGFTYRKIDANGTTDGKKYKGACLEPHVCDTSTFPSPIAHLPNNLKSCDLANHKTCGSDQQCVNSTVKNLNLCCYQTFECISGQVPTQTCDTRNLCSGDNEICYQLTDTKYGCCDQRKSHCDQTGMHAFTRIEDYKFFWGYHKNLNDKWIETNITINGSVYKAGCPSPFSFQLLDYSDPYDALPNDFIDRGPKLRTCEKSSDCRDDEFCGRSYNPSFCSNSSIDKYYDNGCLDRSNDGLPTQFCYEAPNLVVDTLKTGRDRVGFDVCNEQKDCGTGALCVLSNKNETFIKLDANGNTDGKKYNGTCLEAHICDTEIFASPIGHLLNSFESCDQKNVTSCGEDQLCVDAHLFGLDLCCYLKPK